MLWGGFFLDYSVGGTGGEYLQTYGFIDTKQELQDKGDEMAEYVQSYLKSKVGLMRTQYLTPSRRQIFGNASIIDKI